MDSGMSFGSAGFPHSLPVTPCGGTCPRWRLRGYAGVSLWVIYFAVFLHGDKVIFWLYFISPCSPLTFFSLVCNFSSLSSFSGRQAFLILGWLAGLYWAGTICQAQLWSFHIQNSYVLITMILLKCCYFKLICDEKTEAQILSDRV